MPLFAAGLKQDGLGGYDFGFINQSRYNGELSYVDVDSSHGHWSFKVTGYDLGNGDTIQDPSEGVIGKISPVLHSEWFYYNFSSGKLTVLHRHRCIPDLSSRSSCQRILSARRWSGQ